MKDVFSYKDFDIVSERPIQFKDVDGKKGIVTGYFAHFDSVDSDGDVIKKGAFIKTIQEYGPNARKPRIKHLLNHDSWQPLGRIVELKEDNYGLYYESQLGTHALGTDFVKMVESELITEHSIGYRTQKFNQLKPWSEWKEGEAMRELTEIKLWEGSSLTAWGANPNTPLTGMKAKVKVEKLGKRIETMIKFMRDGTVTDETFDQLEISLKQLQQAFIDLSKPEPDEVKATQEEPVIKTTQQEVVRSVRSFAGITDLLN
jgi:HK97 family phage prohead protease